MVPFLGGPLRKTRTSCSRPSSPQSRLISGVTPAHAPCLTSILWGVCEVYTKGLTCFQRCCEHSSHGTISSARPAFFLLFLRPKAFDYGALGHSWIMRPRFKDQGTDRQAKVEWGDSNRHTRRADRQTRSSKQRDGDRDRQIDRQTETCRHTKTKCTCQRPKVHPLT